MGHMGLLGGKRPNRFSFSFLFLVSLLFTPTILLAQQIDTVETTPMVEEVEQKDLLRYEVSFEYLERLVGNTGEHAYLLHEAKIFDKRTGKLNQEICIPRITLSHYNDSRNIVQFHDFYNRGIKEAKDFSVQIESWRDPVHQCFRQQLYYYLFNTTTKNYELDTTLSNYKDVFYYEPLKTMRRYDFESDSHSRITRTFQLENNKWVLIDTYENLFKPLPPEKNSTTRECIWVRENMHTLPLQAVAGKKLEVLVNDTFWLYNTCKVPIHISKVESPFRDFFCISQTILPGERTPLIFHGKLTPISYDFHIQPYNCTLTFKDGHVMGFTIMVPIVSNDAIVYYRPDSSIHYAIANNGIRHFTTAVFSYANGNLRTKGTVQDKDTTLKMGTWINFYDGTPGTDDVVYSKAISLSAMDLMFGYQHNQFKVKVKEHGIWKQPVADYYNNAVRLFITADTDSILAYTDTTLYGIAIDNYKKLPTEFAIQFYLLKANERTLKIGYYKTPFKVMNHQYALGLNYAKFMTGKRTTYQLIDSIINEMQRQYPNIMKVWISRNQRGIDLTNLDQEGRNKVLRQLERDSGIAFIAQLFTVSHLDRLGYCDRRVYADIDIDEPEEFRSAAQRLGFTNIEIDQGGNRFWLTYKSKLLDEGFFEAFDQLTRNKKVRAAYFNSYYEPEPDRMRD